MIKKRKGGKALKTKVFSLIVLLLTLSLSVSVFAAPFDPETFVYVGGAGGPQTLDPAAAYDTASGEIIHHVYDNLFQYINGELDNMGPMLATEVPMVAMVSCRKMDAIRHPRQCEVPRWFGTYC